jgi:hypothetical protein
MTTRNYQSDTQVVIDAFAPAATGLSGEAYELHTRPNAFKQIELRGLDVEQVVARIAGLVAELRKLDETDLMRIWLDRDAEGLHQLASEVRFRRGAGLPDPARVKAWLTRARRTRRADKATP